MFASISNETPVLAPALRDLIALATQPVAWTGPESHASVAGLADVILTALHPDLVFVRLQNRPGASHVKVTRFKGRSNENIQDQELEQLLAPYLVSPTNNEPLTIAYPGGSGVLRVLVLPIGHDGAGGVIVVGSQQPNFPTELDQLLLSGVAHQVAHWSQHVGLPVMLNQRGQIFAAELNVEKLVQAVTDVATQLTGAEFGAFFCNVADTNGGACSQYVLSGTSREPFEHLPLPSSSPVFGPTFDWTEIVRSVDIRQDPRYDQLRPHYGMLPAHLPITSYLAVPVISCSGRVLGGLVFGHSQPDKFSLWHEQQAAGLAAQIAIVIDNAHLYQTEVRTRKRSGVTVEAPTAELRQSETSFQALVNSVQDYAIFMLDPGGTIISWNRGAERIKGYTADEIIGQHFSRFYTPEDVQQGKPQNGLVLAQQAGHFEAEGWRLRKDGSRFWANVVITPIYDKTGELVGFAKVTRDLTERKQAEEKIRQSERHLAEAQHIARLGSWHWDIEKDKVTLSNELYRIYDLEPETGPMTYQRFLEYVHREDRTFVQQTIRQAAKNRRPFDFDYRIVGSDGSIRSLQARGTVIQDDQGRVIALAGTGQDITERKRMEEVLQQSREQLRQLSAHLERTREETQARIARELHDELGGMLTGFKMDVLQLRRMSAAMEPDVVQRLESFSQAIDQGIQTVRRIATELRPAILDDFGLIAAMEWQLNDFQRRSGIRCEWHCSLEEVDLGRDGATAVFRVFQESLTNIARHAQATCVVVTVQGMEAQLSLQIQDNGIGFQPKQAQGSRSFGLVGMRERVSLLGGTVEVQGRPGQGTTVTVVVPLTPELE